MWLGLLALLASSGSSFEVYCVLGFLHARFTVSLSSNTSECTSWGTVICSKRFECVTCTGGALRCPDRLVEPHAVDADAAMSTWCGSTSGQNLCVRWLWWSHFPSDSRGVRSYIPAVALCSSYEHYPQPGGFSSQQRPPLCHWWIWWCVQPKHCRGVWPRCGSVDACCFHVCPRGGCRSGSTSCTLVPPLH